MAPPSRPSLTLKAAKKLESCSEALLDLTPSTEPTLVASRTNAVYMELPSILDTLSGVKDLCDVGKNTYPNYPRIRETMVEAGEKIYKAKQEVESLKERCLGTPLTDLIGWRQIGVDLADIASKLRAIVFVPLKKKKEGAA